MLRGWLDSFSGRSTDHAAAGPRVSATAIARLIATTGEPSQLVATTAEHRPNISPTTQCDLTFVA
jgi:hypothetical protein